MFYGNAVSKSDRPAGCYWIRDDKVYFNEIIDPSQTDPWKTNGGGVCMRTSK